MKPTLDDMIEATVLCRKFDATVVFAFTKDGSSVDCVDREIEIDLHEATSREWLWSLVFHELAHLECYDKKIFEIYHYDTLSDKKMYQYVMKHGLRIERFVDRLAQKNMKKYRLGLRFKKSYVSIRDVKWLHDWFEKSYGDF